MNEMNAPSWLADPWVNLLGWTLVQFLWQGVVIAGVFAIVRGTCARSWSSRSRYALACATLALMTLAPILTFLAGGGVGRASARWLLPGTSGWDSFMPALVAVWLSGVLALSIRLLGGWFAARNLRTRGVRPAPAHWQETFDRLCERLDISQRVRLLISPRIEVPVVVGWLRPVVLVPLGALTGLPPDYVTALLAHELAHVCRRDYLVNLLQHVAEAMLFYHPATWWVSAQIRIEREMSCDDIAVAVQGDPLVYARALTELDTSRRAWRTLEVAANGPSLLLRIRRLLGHTVSPWQLLPGPGALVAIGLLWLVGVAAVAARTARPIAVAGRAAAPAGVETADSRGASGLLATALLGPIGPPQKAQPSRPLATVSGPVIAVDSGGQPPRDDMDQTSTIRGRVTSAATGLPLRDATVRLSPSVGFSAFTDEDGRYELSGVPLGTYNVNAEKPGFLDGFIGRRSPLTPLGEPLEATGGRAHDQIDMALLAGGVITGVVLDAAGDPLAGVVVGARFAAFINGVPRLPVSESVSDVTDDLGRYRLFGLQGGTYYLVASPRNPTSSGDGYSSPASPVIFYPGTSRSTEARPVRVENGRELTASPFTVVPARAATVSGFVTRQDGKPLGHVTVSLRVSGYPFDLPIHHPKAEVRGGAFVFPRVAPGEYTLVAQSDEDGVALATSPLVIDGSDLTVPPLVLRRTSTLRGRVTFDVDAPTVSATQAGIVLWDEGDTLAIPISARADWSFEATGLLGRKRVDVYLAVPPEEWALKSIRAGDQDLMEAPLEFDGRDIDNVEVRLTQPGTVISGQVSGRQPDSGGGVVLIFPEDPDRWRALRSFRIKRARIDEGGRYRAVGLVPGKYLAVAFESLEPSDERDLISTLERLAPDATALTIAEGEQRALDLRLVFK